MKQWKEKIIRYAVRNRKSPEENRRRVGKSLSLLASAKDRKSVV